MSAGRRCPEEVAPGVYRVRTGRGALAANAYLVSSGAAWVLVDTGWPHQALGIRLAGEAVFGRESRPTALVLTHMHPDHSGSAPELSRLWGLQVHVHPEEMRFAPGRYLPEYANPLDRWVVGPLTRLVPPSRLEAWQAKGSLEGHAVAFAPAAGVPGLPEWECIPTPGHTPGHLALLRAGDGVLLSGDAVLTVDLNSPAGFLRAAPQLSGPPRYTTWDWSRAGASVDALAAHHPRVLAPGHGGSMRVTADDLHGLAERMREHGGAPGGHLHS
jgi:glyoxylase-like metal-dependent hydrolase (beta-lactamase superfamily II)